MEWLRQTLLQPIAEFAHILPIPLRHSLTLLVLALPLCIVPLGFVLRVFGYFVAGLSWIVAKSAETTLHLVSTQRSGFLDVLDPVAESILVRGATGIALTERLRMAPFGRFRLRKRGLAAAALVPLLAWIVRPALGDITFGHLIDSSFVHMTSLEQWALTGTNSTVVPASTGQTSEPRTAEGVANLSSPALEATTVPEPTATTEPATIHQVRRGESVRGIAAQYGVTTKCIMTANRSRYPDQNWDALAIGQELRIPADDSACKQ